MGDAGQVLGERRAQLHAVVGRFRQAPPVGDDSTGPALRERERLVNDLRRLLMPYETVKLRYLFPLVAARLAGGSGLVDRATDEKRAVEAELTALRWLPDRDHARNDAADRLARAVERLLVHEEGLVARLAEVSPPHEWAALGERLQRGLRWAPTRAHPDLPSRPWVPAVVAPLVGAVDRLRDKLDPPPSGL